MGSVCYGIDLRPDSCVVVRGTRLRGRLACTTVDARAAEAESGGGRRATVGCLSVAESIVRPLEAPFASRKKALKVFPSMLDVELPFPLENCVYGFLLPRRTEEGRVCALAVAARVADVQARLAAFQARGLDPVILDHEGLAIWAQSVKERPAQAGVTRVVLHLGPSHTAVAVGKGDAFISAHAAGVSGLNQIERVLRALGEAGPREYAWTGPGAADERHVAALAEPLVRVLPGSSFCHDEPDTFLARALAARTLERDPSQCNLRTGPLTHPRLRAERRRYAVTTAALYLAAGLLLCAANAGWWAAAARLDSRAKQAVTSLAGALAPHATIQPGMEARAVEAALRKDAPLMEPFQNALGRSLTATLAAIVTAGHDNQLRYQTLSLRRADVTLDGTAADWDRCERLLPVLRQAGYAVRLDRHEAGADERVRFSIRPDTSAGPARRGRGGER
ncbi:MAG: hypothetical protein JXR37_06180 [Kiritimatiellae bacterium]|nr:hypothetical protein [Kiritimatiellia bacterium]